MGKMVKGKWTEFNAYWVGLYFAGLELGYMDGINNQVYRV